MLKEQAKLLSKVLFACDLFTTALSFSSAYGLRQFLSDGNLSRLYPFSQYLTLLLIIVPAWAFFLYCFDTYRSYRMATLRRELWDLTKVVLCGGITLVVIIFAVKWSFVSRSFIVVFLCLNVILLAVERFTIRLWLRTLRTQDRNIRYVLIVGTGARAQKVLDRIQHNRHWGFRVVGFVDREPELVGQRIGGVDVIGAVESLADIVKKHIVDEVIVAVPRKWLDDLERGINSCIEVGLNVRLAADLYNPPVGKMTFGELDDLPLLSWSSAPHCAEALFVKRVVDVLIAATVLTLLSPLILLTAVAIKIDSRGPVIYRQKRVGLNGRLFTMYKFRSMVDVAEQLRRDFQALNEMTGPAFKIKNDPRLTRVGRIIRKWSIDELPQLFNVVRGDMSLVGIRPPLPDEVDIYEPWQRRRLSMRPGITCVWQVSGRNTVNFDQWMKMDLSYIDNWSLKLDFRLLLKTIPAVLLGKGAM